MSIFAYRKTIPSGYGYKAPAEPTLHELRAQLRAVETRAQNRGGEVYRDIIVLALVIVNGVCNKPVEYAPYEPVARQAAAVALSVTKSVDILIPQQIPGLGSINAEEAKFVEALAPQIRSMKDSLTKAFGVLTQTSESTGFGSIFGSSGGSRNVERILKDLRASHEAFSFKASVFMDNLLLTDANGGDKFEADANILTWQQVEVLQDRETRSSHSLILSGEHSFWNNTYEATIDGRQAVIKTYPGRSIKDFRRDLESISGSRHSNLPSLYGFSKKGTSTPFIVMSMQSFKPFFEHIASLCETSPNSALRETWRMLIIMRSTADYLANGGMLESDNSEAVGEVIKKGVVDNMGKVILAPSPPPNDKSRYIVDPRRRTITSAFSVIYQDNIWRNSERAIDEATRIDHLPRPLRPLRYALAGSSKLVLQATSFQLEGDVISQLLALARWSSLKSGQRRLWWPIPFYDEDYQPVVGDIGRFSLNAIGQSVFVPLGNFQTEIGGYIWESMDRAGTGERLPGQVWRFLCSEYCIVDEDELEAQYWSYEIPEEFALKFLLVNAPRLSRKFDTPAVDLVLVTSTSLYLRWCDAPLDEEPPLLDDYSDEEYIYVHFDVQGRPLRYYESSTETPLDIGTPDVTTLAAVNASSSSIRPFFTVQGVFPSGKGLLRLTSSSPSFVQIEEYELGLGSDAILHQTAPKFGLGDIGCFIQGADGARHFYALCNAVEDLVDPKLQPWERNECEDIGGGVWRSPPINCTSETTFSFAWTLESSINLPDDLVPFYFYFLASRGGNKVLPTHQLAMVRIVHHRVQGTFFPRPNGLPLRFFVHFDKQGIPANAYWSQLDDPYQSLGETLPALPGCATEVFPVMSSGDVDQQLSGFTTKKRYERLSVPGTPRSGQAISEPSPKLGDVGYWVRDSQGRQTEQWHQLGRLQISAFDRKISHTTAPRDNLCYQESEFLWRSRLPLYNHDNSPEGVVRCRWIEVLPELSSKALSDQLEELIRDSGVPRDEILIVSKTTTEIHARASSNALNWKPIILDYPDNDDADEIHYLQFNVALPPGGGCHGFWSSATTQIVLDFYGRWVQDINYQALSKLDLNGWQRSGCTARTSVNFECTPITELAQEARK